MYVYRKISDPILFRDSTVIDLQFVMGVIRASEKRGKGAPLHHNLYRRCREAILDRTDLAREQQARKALIERST